MEQSTQEPTPENGGWAVKIKLILTQRGEEKHNHNRSHHCYLSTHHVVGTTDRTPFPPHEVTIPMQGHGTERASLEAQGNDSCPGVGLCLERDTGKLCFAERCSSYADPFVRGRAQRAGRRSRAGRSGGDSHKIHGLTLMVGVNRKPVTPPENW